jgi:hypothetical protein
MSSKDQQDTEYVSHSGEGADIPVVSDSKDELGAGTRGTDSDERLGMLPPSTLKSQEGADKLIVVRDDKDAIDESNIIDDRTRNAGLNDGGYAEPGDDEGLPGPEDGTTSN